MRGYFARGWDHGAGVDPGRTFGSTQADSFASHNHTYVQTIFPDPSPTGSGGGVMSRGSTQTGTTGSTGGTETRPKNVALLYIIKT
jgi:hypothetical protein